MACQTCDMIRGLLMAKGVDPLVIESAMPLVELAETKVKKRIRSTKQRAFDKMKSVAWKKANSEGRKNNGDFRSGWDMKRIAQRANKLLKAGTTKGQVRKTARRAFER
jgi:hypothetical protein